MYISSVIPMDLKLHSGHYSSTRLIPNQKGNTLSSLLELTYYIMRGNTFYPYPCAGVSIATLLFERSPGSLLSRDSQGNDYVLKPGDFILKCTNSGIVYDETLFDSSLNIEGIQLLFRTSTSKHRSPPETYFIPKNLNKIIRKGSNKMKIIIDEESKKNLPDPLPLEILELHLYQDERFQIIPEASYVLFQIEGHLTLENGSNLQKISGPQSVIIHSNEKNNLNVKIEKYSHCILIKISKNHEMCARNNSICMPTEAELTNTITRYINGEMGFLSNIR
ncbi:hypothetical protein [Mixta sp. Marseille-Q2659]|uniref:hypothetical protein n=1 Tax=Mixta sp. Marseille-Q2659 TaxID=2736607 RepID=UPI0023BA2277|nr:hypothetical protein [Mixta sp. Marseille-Q2659]